MGGWAEAWMGEWTDEQQGRMARSKGGWMDEQQGRMRRWADEQQGRMGGRQEVQKADTKQMNGGRRGRLYVVIVKSISNTQPVEALSLRNMTA
eukprot:351829-Chlamydomonas_euryale.AAC.3